VDEAYMDGSDSEHGVKQAYKLALYLSTFPKFSVDSLGEFVEIILSPKISVAFHQGVSV
jgi:hypothetical protein